MTSQRRLVIGCMTGTSLDALDAALVEVRGCGRAMRITLVDSIECPLGDLQEPLRAASLQQPLSAMRLAELALQLGELHARAARNLAEGRRIDLVCAHGQTLAHAPPVSLQLLNAAPIARDLGCPVVFDLRQADLAAGGQGAPITPISDAILYASVAPPWCVVNLGGFCNITHCEAHADAPDSLPPLRGKDVCACNHVLNAVAALALGRPFDENGAAALRGTPHPLATRELVELLSAQHRAGRSLGTGDEAPQWVRRHLGAVSPDDLAASAVEALAMLVAQAAQPARTVILAGGSAKNAALVRALRRLAGPAVRVALSDELGVPAAQREAMGFAVLGALCADGVPITIPGITRLPEGRSAPLSGTWALPPAVRDHDRPGAIPPVLREVGSAGAACAPPLVGGAGASPVRASANPPPDRGHLLTEQRNPSSMNFDDLPALDAAALMNREDQNAVEAVRRALPELSALIEAIVPRFMRNGRLIYCGAGTSGRLGVLDASECPPTFCVPPERIIGLIAGGDAALRRSSEGREDEPDGAHAELAALTLTPDDSIIAIAAGGTTPYALGALACGRRAGALTALLSCAPGPRPTAADHHVVLATGPEVLTGSTRLKAGTATKLALNTISTVLMARTGRIYENLMVDLRATNDKLRDRAARIIGTLTGLDRDASLALLARAHGSVKHAVLMHRSHVSFEAAEARLRAHGGVLRAALDANA